MFNIARLFAGGFNSPYNGWSVCMTKRSFYDISAYRAGLSRCLRCLCTRYMSRFVFLCMTDGAFVPMICFIVWPNLTIAMSYFSRFATVVTCRVAGVVICMRCLVLLCVADGALVPMVCFVVWPNLTIAMSYLSCLTADVAILIAGVIIYMRRFVFLCVTDGAFMPMLLGILIPFLTEAMTCFSCLAAIVTGRVAGVVISVCRLVCYCITVCTFMPMICLIARPFCRIAVRSRFAWFKCFRSLFAAGAGVIVNGFLCAGCGGLEVCFARILLIEVVRMTKCGFYDISADGASLRSCFGSCCAGGMCRYVLLISAGALMPMVCFVGWPCGTVGMCVRLILPDCI